MPLRELGLRTPAPGCGVRSKSVSWPIIHDLIFPIKISLSLSPLPSSWVSSSFSLSLPPPPPSLSLSLRFTHMEDWRNVSVEQRCLNRVRLREAQEEGPSLPLTEAPSGGDLEAQRGQGKKVGEVRWDLREQNERWGTLRPFPVPYPLAFLLG